MKNKKYFLAFIVAFLLVGISIPSYAPSYAGTFSEAGPWEKTGLVTLSLITSVVYTPVKLTYAVLSTVTSGVVLGLTGGDDNGAASKIAKRSVNGDWYVTPDVFLWNKNLEFIGPESELESKPENKPESKPENKLESKPESTPETKPESKPESKSEIKTESIPENMQ